MPRFNESEKAIIQEKLFVEGERLFTQYGIKKVTVDDLVKAAGIAKGSFYAFYTNKEHLYFDITARLQQKLWSDLDVFLRENQTLPPVELTKQSILWMFSKLDHYPMLKQNDGEIAAYLYRKLPPEVLAAHTKDDSYEITKLQEYGVHFKCEVDTVTKILQILAIGFLSLQSDAGDNSEPNSEAITMILDGVLKEIVCDERDQC